MEIEYDRFRKVRASGYPVRHKRKENFYPRVKVPEGYKERIQEIIRLDAEIERFILSADDYLEFINTAYASNIHWSTRLEGNPISESGVKRITRRMLRGDIEETEPGPVQEIINHLIQWFNIDYFSMPWTFSMIKELQDMLLQDTGSEDPTGVFRDDRASITDSHDFEYFIPCPHEHIEQEMGWLIDWVNDHSHAFDTLTAATIFFHEFESIHPFFDGNGRVGRTLFHQYIQSNGLRNSNLIIFEGHLFKEEEIYYEILSYTDETSDYSHLLDFFSQVIHKSYIDAVKEFSNLDLLSSGLDEDLKALLRRSKAYRDWFTLKDAIDWVDGKSSQTIRNKLSHLVDLGALEEKGKTKGKSYRFNDPIKHVKKLVDRMYL